MSRSVLEGGWGFNGEGGARFLSDGSSVIGDGSTTLTITYAMWTDIAALGGGFSWDLTGATTGAAYIGLTDNLANAFEIKEGSNSYLKFTTTNSGEIITAGKRVVLSGGADGVIGATTPAAATVTTLTANTSVSTDTIAEKTAATGVTIDGCLIKDGKAAVALSADACTGNAATATLAAQATKVAATSRFRSTNLTGTGSQQSIAHGLATTPTWADIRVVSSATPTQFPSVDFSAAPDATNVYVTADVGSTFVVMVEL